MRRAVHLFVLASGLAAASCQPGGGSDAGTPADAPVDDVDLSDGGADEDAAVDDAAVSDGDVPSDVEPPPDASCSPCVSDNECAPVSGCFPLCGPPIYAEPGTPCGEGGTCDAAGGCSAGPITCGDGIRHRGEPGREGCDDGDMDLGDACSPLCIPTPFVVASRADGTDLPPGPAFGVAADGSGSALFVWTAALTGSGGSEVRARRYASDGDVAGDELTVVAGLGVGVDPHPVVAGLRSGGWVVAWEDPAVDMSSLGIAYRVVRADGTFGSVRRANEARLLRQHEPAIATLGDGVVIAWSDESGLVDGSSASRVVFRIVGAGGIATLPEVPVAVSASDELGEPSLATSSAHEIVVVWTDRGSPPSYERSVWLRRFIDAVPADGPPVAVASAEAHSPSAAALEDGYFAIAWTTRTSDGSGDVLARVITTGSDPVASTPVTIAAALDPSMMPVGETEPSVAHLVAQDFLVTWTIGRDRTGVGVAASSAPPPPDLAALGAILADATVGDVSVSRGPTGVWVSFGVAERSPVSGAWRAVYGYLLPPD